MKNNRLINGVIALMIGMSTIFSMESCKNFVHDDLSNCPQGLEFNFYSRKARVSTDTIYPESVKYARVYAFDHSGILQGIFDSKTTDHGRQISDLKPYRLAADFNKNGEYIFATYAGENLEDYDFGNPIVGKTKRDEMKMTFKYNGDVVFPAPSRLWYGEKKQMIHDNSKNGTIIQHVPVDLFELTNRYTFHIEDAMLGHEYEIQIVDDNETNNLYGNIVKEKPILYTSGVTTASNDKITKKVNSLKLEPNRNVPTIKVLDKTFHFEAEVKLLKLIDKVYGPLDYDYFHDYEFIIKAPKGAHTGIMVKVNNWILVSNDITLGN